MTDKKIFLIRHGETDWNREKIWQGHRGPGLNTNGREQIKSAALKLKDANITKFYSSDIRRAVETSQIISDFLDLDFVTEPAFRERDMGDYTGLPESEVLKRNPGLEFQHGFLGSNDLPSVEKWDSFVNRVTGGLQNIMSVIEGNTAIVTHGGVIYIALAYFDKTKILPVVPNGNVSVVRVKPNILVETVYL